MRIEQSDFLTILSGVKQYSVPIYQRNYTWEKNNCEVLLKDIVKAGTPGNPNHYVGSVIVKEEVGAGGVNIYNVIDGQQRTTTINLLLLALEKYYSTYALKSTLSPTTAAILGNISNLYLTNQALKNTSLFGKLYLKQGIDRDEFENLLHGVVGNGKLSKNYKYFLNELSNNSYNPTVIFEGIRNSQIALVILSNTDNAQLLFEAVNDTGIDLSEIDKVRNWIFMGLPNNVQDRLYRTYWIRMEEILGNHTDAFLRYYTILKTSKIESNKYYSSFKNKFILNVGTESLTEALLSDILEYANIYDKYLKSGFNVLAYNTQIDYIKDTKKDNFTPVILKILKGSSNEKLEMLKYIESYIVRRDILNIPTNSLNPAMINMLNSCDDLASLRNRINNLPNKQYMPSDNELRTQLKTRNFYGLSSSCYYLLRIEKYFNPAFSLADPTIEHILPETMHTTANPKPGVANVDDYNWELDLGPDATRIHDTYQHTLGNLTILPRGENARMGDYRFEKKKNWGTTSADGFVYGYSHTPIRISQSLRNVNVWNEHAINDRCDELVNYICAIWPHP